MKAHLQTAPLTVAGQLVDASNMTLLAQAEHITCIYKPTKGETPLWDFPQGTLGKREVAAYELSTLFPTTLVPLTVWREDGPFGPGMCQLFIEDAQEFGDDVAVVPVGLIPENFIEVLKARDSQGTEVSLVHADHAQLRWLALFDAVANNADRKGGHILRSGSHMWGIDHGVTFHAEPKLRTVLWGWAGTPLRDDEKELLESLMSQVDAALSPWLSTAEVAGVSTRISDLLKAGLMPTPSPSWPSIPWPVF